MKKATLTAAVEKALLAAFNNAAKAAAAGNKAEHDLLMKIAHKYAAQL